MSYDLWVFKVKINGLKWYIGAPPNVSLLLRLTKFKTVITNKLFNRKLIFIDRNTPNKFIHHNMKLEI